MKKKTFICACAASLLVCNCINVSPVFAVDYSFIQKVEPLLYDQTFQQELAEDTKVESGKPDTGWFDPEDRRSEYEISTEEQLLGLAKLVNTRKIDWQVNEVYTFKDTTIHLMNDIELTQEWTPIGSDGSYAFEGTFQGNGHTISGLNIENSENKNQGFFGSLKGTVNNLKLKGSIETTSDNAGGIAAYLTDTATVENCTVEVNVSGRDRIGGVAGYSFGGTIINCHSLGNVKGNVKVGGVLGENWNGTVKKCSNQGQVVSAGTGVGTYGTGGIAGRSVASAAVVEECYNKGNILSANECAGGIVGYANAKGSVISSCYNMGSVSGASTAADPYGYVGGIVGSIGENGVNLRNSYNAGAVRNGKYTGGILGSFTADFYDKIETYIINNYYTDGSAPTAVGKEKEYSGKRSYPECMTVKSSGDLRSTRMAYSLSPAFRPDTGNMLGINEGFPVFRWQETANSQNRDEILKKMDIGYKKQIRRFFKAHPYGTSSGEVFLKACNPQLFFEETLNRMEEQEEHL